MDKKLSKEELINLVREIRNPKLSDEQLGELVLFLKSNILDPEVTDLIFFTELSPEEVIEKALEYKPIIL